MVKLDIISGFLGAGKTTLINKFLNEAYRGEKLALLENEFGEIGIDGDFLKGDNLNVMEIANGCICCSLQGNFIDGMCELIEKFNPDRVIIEPTGIGKISDIISACREVYKKIDVRINAVITVVNAVMFPIFSNVGGDFFQEQIKEAKVIVLSCVQNITDEDMQLDSIISYIKEMNPKAVIFSKPWEKLDSIEIIATSELLCDGVFHLSDEGEEHHHHDEDDEHHHLGGFESYSFYFDDDLQLERINEFIFDLKSGKFGEIFRGKGFIKSDGKFLKLDYVYGEFFIDEVVYEGKGKIVIIGKNIKENEIEDALKTSSL